MALTLYSGVKTTFYIQHIIKKIRSDFLHLLFGLRGQCNIISVQCDAIRWEQFLRRCRLVIDKTLSIYVFFIYGKNAQKARNSFFKVS